MEVYLNPKISQQTCTYFSENSGMLKPVSFLFRFMGELQEIRKTHSHVRRTYRAQWGLNEEDRLAECSLHILRHN